MPDTISRTRVFAGTLRDRHLRTVLFAYFTFNLTELGSWIAVLVWGYEKHGIGGASILATLQLVPSAVLAPAGAAFLARFSHVRALALGYALQAVLLIGAGALIVSAAPAPVTITVIAAAAVSITLTRPVHLGLLPLLSNRTEDLTAANGMSGMAEGAAAFLGPLFSGAVTGWLGPGPVVAMFGVLSGLAAAAAVRTKPVGNADSPPAVAVPPSPRRFLAVVREPGVIALLSLSGLGFMVTGLLDVLLVALALDELRLTAAGPGLMTSALGIGMVIGGFATLLLIGRKSLSGPLGTALGALGIPLALLGFARWWMLTFVLIVAVGSARSFLDATARTLTQRVLPDRTLGTVFGLQESMLMGGLCLGALLAPLLTSSFGVRGAFLIAGIGFPVLALALMPKLIRLDRSATVSLDDYRILAGVPALALLPPRLIERLARDSRRIDAPTGTAVVVQGEVGDAFYVIDSGSARVLVDDHAIRDLGDGDWFGEIALLRGVPRTATVVTSAECRLLVIDRDQFLFTVTGTGATTALDKHRRDHYRDLERD